MQLGAGLIDLLYSGTKENMRLLGVLLFLVGWERRIVKI